MRYSDEEWKLRIWANLKFPDLVEMNSQEFQLWEIEVEWDTGPNEEDWDSLKITLAASDKKDALAQFRRALNTVGFEAFLNNRGKGLGIGGEALGGLI